MLKNILEIKSDFKKNRKKIEIYRAKSKESQIINFKKKRK
jgi:hypothetical protein